MSSFSSFEKYTSFNKENFISFWQKYVYGTEDFEKLDSVRKRSETDKMRDRIKNLWLSFNENRESFRKKYSGTKKFIRAYISSFYLSNIQRIYSLLTQRSNAAELVKCFENSGDTFTVLDFGAGPMSASAALLIALDKAGMNIRGKKIRILTVERSPQMIETGLELLRSGFSACENIEHENFSSPLKVVEKCDFILCANVFNEIPELHRLSNLERMISILKGCLLITEPGQEIHSKALSELRNEMIKKNTNSLNIISPCLHSGPCSLSSKSERPDWCWFNTPWHVPEQAAVVDRITGLDHRQLNFSYLFVKRDSVSHNEKNYRVISDIISPVKKGIRSRFENWMRNNIIEGNINCLSRVQDQNISKLLLCGSDGKLYSVIGDKVNFSGFKRGSIMNSVPQNSCICRERNT